MNVLEDLCEDLLGTLKDIVDISSELSHRDHVRIDNLEEVSTECRLAVPSNSVAVLFRLSVEMMKRYAGLTQASVVH